MKDQEDFHGDISLAPTEATKTLKNPKSLKTVGFMPEEDVLLDTLQQGKEKQETKLSGTEK